MFRTKHVLPTWFGRQVWGLPQQHFPFTAQPRFMRKLCCLLKAKHQSKLTEEKQPICHGNKSPRLFPATTARSLLNKEPIFLRQEDVLLHIRGWGKQLLQEPGEPAPAWKGLSHMRAREGSGQLPRRKARSGVSAQGCHGAAGEARPGDAAGQRCRVPRAPHRSRTAPRTPRWGASPPRAALRRRRRR